MLDAANFTRENDETNRLIHSIDDFISYVKNKDEDSLKAVYRIMFEYVLRNELKECYELTEDIINCRLEYDSVPKLIGYLHRIADASLIRYNKMAQFPFDDPVRDLFKRIEKLYETIINSNGRNKVINEIDEVDFALSNVMDWASKNLGEYKARYPKMLRSLIGNLSTSYSRRIVKDYYLNKYVGGN